MTKFVAGMLSEHALLDFVPVVTILRAISVGLISPGHFIRDAWLSSWPVAWTILDVLWLLFAQAQRNRIS